MKYQSQEYFEYHIMSVNKGTKIRLGEGVQVADRRRWQSAMTSPIGDVGSERVKEIYKCTRAVRKLLRQYRIFHKYATHLLHYWQKQ